MYQAGVLEKAIQEQTGHISLSGLRHYERTNISQQQGLSKVLATSKKSAFQDHYFAHSCVVRAIPNQSQNFSFANCQVNNYNSSTAPFSVAPS